MSTKDIVSDSNKNKPYVIFTDTTERNNWDVFEDIRERIRDLIEEVYGYHPKSQETYKIIVARLRCDPTQALNYIIKLYADEKGKERPLLSTHDKWAPRPEMAMLDLEERLIEKKLKLSPG